MYYLGKFFSLGIIFIGLYLLQILSTVWFPVNLLMVNLNLMQFNLSLFPLWLVCVCVCVCVCVYACMCVTMKICLLLQE
jgi:hypothetical protein